MFILLFEDKIYFARLVSEVFERFKNLETMHKGTAKGLLSWQIVNDLSASVADRKSSFLVTFWVTD